MQSIYLLEKKQVYVVLFVKNDKCSIIRVFSESAEFLTETIAYQDYELRSCAIRGEEIVTVAENEKSSYIRTWNVRHCPMSQQKYKVAVRLSLRIRNETVTSLCVDENRDELVGVLVSGKVCVWNFMTGALNRCEQISPTPSRVDKIIHNSSLGFVVQCSEGLEIWSRDFKNRTLLNASRLCAVATLDDDRVLTGRSNGCVEMWSFLCVLFSNERERNAETVCEMFRFCDLKFL